MKCLSMKQEIRFTEKLEVNSLARKSGKLMSCYKSKIFIKRFYKKYGLETSFSSFYVINNYPQPLLENEMFGTT